MNLKKLAAVLALFVLLAVPVAASATPASGYWWNPATAGSGFVIEVQGNQMFFAGFLYATNGEATWVASYGPMASATQYSGPLVTFSGGQTLTGAFQTATQNAGSVGNLAITFTDNSHASLTWPGGTVAIQRLDFGPGGSEAVQPLTTPEPGWWWNPAEGGRGFAIEIQGNAMYFAGYMYDPNGNPVWYVASGPMTSPTVFEGTWTQYQNGLTLTGPYRPPTLANASVGAVSMAFSDSHTAQLTLPNGRGIPLVRYAFGAETPALSMFTPAAAAPAATLTLNGAGFDPSGQIIVTLANTNGNYSVSIPPTSVTAGTISVTVPPFVNSVSNNFASGTVSLIMDQKANGVSLNTNTLNGFTIQTLPYVYSGAGNATLALIHASLSEAQRLQTAVQGTPQGSPQTLAAIATQVTNLEALVTAVQNVIQNGVTFELGIVGGVNLYVTPSNIVDVDQLILATLQSLSSGTGTGNKRAEAAASACLAAEAAAFAAGMNSGASLATLEQLALNLVQASNTSSACGTVTAFTPAYQTIGGGSGSGYGFANGAGIATLTQRLPGVSLFATTLQTMQPEVGLNALTSSALAGQTAVVQSAILNVATLATPVTNAFINNATGQVSTAIIGAQNVLTAVAPPPPGAANSSITGTWSGTWSWIAGANNCVFSDGGLVSMNLVQNGSSVTGANLSATGFQVRLDSDCSLQYVDVASGGTLSGTVAGGTINYSASFPLVKFGQPFVWTGTATFNGTNNTITGNLTAYGTNGTFTLVRQ
jgi:hypothetical protein